MIGPFKASDFITSKRPTDDGILIYKQEAERYGVPKSKPTAEADGSEQWTPEYLRTGWHERALAVTPPCPSTY
eukprot:SAG11_NODE_5197_length_1633_cov_1.258149_2_plen_73_part_00